MEKSQTKEGVYRQGNRGLKFPNISNPKEVTEQGLQTWSSNYIMHKNHNSKDKWAVPSVSTGRINKNNLASLSKL